MIPKLRLLAAALEELEAAPDLPMEARLAVEALRANVRAGSVWVDGTTSHLIAKLLRGLAPENPTSDVPHAHES
jgi:hypothetical protein